MAATSTAIRPEPAQQSSRTAVWPEARFRVPAANALPRSVRVISLNDSDVDVAMSRARGARPHVVFSGPADFRALMGENAFDRRTDAAGCMSPVQRRRLRDWLGTPDLVLIVGDEADDPALGILAAHEYPSHSITISGLIRRSAVSASNDSSTSNALRPLCSMIVLVNDNGYLDDMLDALGAKE